MEKTMSLDSVGERVRKCNRENNGGGVRSNRLTGVSKEFLYLF